MNDCFEIADEGNGVEFVRMKRLERMSRELLVGNLLENNEGNVTQPNDSFANENENKFVKIGEQLAKELQATHKDLQKEIQEMKNQLQTMQLDMHYLALSKMQEIIDSSVIGEQEMKQLAVILNRVTGIILTILNVGLIIYTGLTMFTPLKLM